MLRSIAFALLLLAISRGGSARTPSPVAGNASAGNDEAQAVIVTANPLGSSSLFDLAAPASALSGQGLMLRAFDEYGNLAYTFVETVSFMHGPLVARAVGGLFFIAGMLLMAFNVYMTIVQAKREEKVSAAAVPA